MANKIKIFTIFLGIILFRLLPLRAPNVEPIMASIMPISRKFGPYVAFLFGFMSIFLFDLLTNMGLWTFITGITYGIIGVASYFYFNKDKSSIFYFIMFSIFATIFFDFITGVVFAPMWNQNIWNALILQIPFTILHLAGNIGFALTLSPVINKWLLKENSYSFKELLLKKIY